jgi:hypothetical protein
MLLIKLSGPGSRRTKYAMLAPAMVRILYRYIAAGKMSVSRLEYLRNLSVNGLKNSLMRKISSFILLLPRQLIAGLPFSFLLFYNNRQNKIKKQGFSDVSMSLILPVC